MDKREQMFVELVEMCDSLRRSTQEIYDLIVPAGFTTRMRTPITDMNMVQIDKLREQMREWLLDRGVDVAI
jgi:hypothetical protein